MNPDEETNEAREEEEAREEQVDYTSLLKKRNPLKAVQIRDLAEKFQGESAPPVVASPVRELDKKLARNLATLFPDPKVRELVLAGIHCQDRNWAFRVAMSSCCAQVLAYFKKDVRASSMLATACVLKGEFDELRCTFSLTEMHAKYSAHPAEVDGVLSAWKLTSHVEVTKAEHAILMKIVKVLLKNNNNMPVETLLQAGSVQQEIGDRRVDFKAVRFVELIECSSYGQILKLDGANVVLDPAIDPKSCKENKTFLSCTDVVSQHKRVLKSSGKPTKLQRFLYGKLNGDGPCASLIVGPPGCGKTTGLTACTHGIQALFPVNFKSFIDAILNAMSARTPVAIVQHDSDGKIVMEPLHETLCKLLKYDTTTSLDFDDKLPKSLEELHRRILQRQRVTQDQIRKRNDYLRKLDVEECMARKGSLTREDEGKISASHKKRAKTLSQMPPVFTSTIGTFIVHPSLRAEGGVGVCAEIEEYGRMIRKPVTVIIDDFGTNFEVDEPSVVQLCASTPRIVLLTGTPPSNMGDPESAINRCRAQAGLPIFETNTFNDTLGPGLDLYHLEDGVRKLHSLLLGPRSVFEHNPSALQTISVDLCFELLEKLRGYKELRNDLLEQCMTIGLDDLRREVVGNVYGLTDEDRIRTVTSALERVNSMHSDSMDQVLHLSNDPCADSIRKIGPIVLTVLVDERPMAYLDYVRRKIATYERQKELQRREEERAEKHKDSRSAEGGGTKLQRAVSALEDKQEVVFDKTGITAYLSLKDVVELLEYNVRGEISDANLMHLLQNGALVVDSGVSQNIVGDLLCKSIKSIFGTPRNMGIGVDIQSLTGVYLPDSGDVAQLIQNMGRVGRTSQNGSGMVVFQSLDQLVRVFEHDYQGDLERTFKAFAERVLG